MPDDRNYAFHSNCQASEFILLALFLFVVKIIFFKQVHCLCERIILIEGKKVKEYLHFYSYFQVLTLKYFLIDVEQLLIILMIIMSPSLFFALEQGSQTRGSFLLLLWIRVACENTFLSLIEVQVNFICVTFLLSLFLFCN